jgi:asparagine synthase (glutamine-hydrolysing)
MCGITGIFDQRGKREIDKELLTRMNDMQYHRGPDQSGLFVEAGIGLGHRRLSIIDLSGGQQPLFNEDNSVVVVYNGEIYNFNELAAELKSYGHTFRTHSDTEVIVHAWEQWGQQCVDQFRGMFAFAIWDKQRRTLFLARDRLGIKPLYYAELSDGHFIFSSELKALRIHPGFIPEIDPFAVEEYFAYGYVPDPRTIFKNVKKLEPGYTLTISSNNPIPVLQQYWDVPFATESLLSDKQIEYELIERLREAVKIRMIAEVPLGAFLSGGVDSSAVVALMSEAGQEHVNTCSIGFSDPKYNESEYASQVSTLYHTNHYMKNVEADDYDLIDKLSSIYDEPYADSSAIPTYRVCELARQRVTVALSGDGGDENFAGYRRYRWHMHEEKIRSLLPGFVRRPLFGILGNIYPKLDWAPRYLRAKSTFQSLSRDALDAYLHTVSVVYDDVRKPLYSSSFRRELQGYHARQVFDDISSRAPTSDPLSLVQYIDMKTYLPGDILTKVDRASMAHSLEVRVPLLDHKFVEWVSCLPHRYKLRGREGKYIFKRALETRLPHDVLYRSKMGFAVPLASWFRGPLRERVQNALLGEPLLSTGMFNDKHIARIVSEHQSGMREHSAVIWSLLMFDSFLKKNGL